MPFAKHGQDVLYSRFVPQTSILDVGLSDCELISVSELTPEDVEVVVALFRAKMLRAICVADLEV